nr:MAG TPA: hypothetical protein [Caudoviricetes sp.]
MHRLLNLVHMGRTTTLGVLPFLVSSSATPSSTN